MNILKRLYQSYRNFKMRLHSNTQLKGAKYGKNNNVFGRIDIVEPQKLQIGNDCSFNHGCYINASNQVIIGDDVTLSAKAGIISTGIDYKKWILGNKSHISNGKVCIGNHVWIGADAVILPGVSITGEYVVIGANSVVTKNITESNCIYAGTPAVKIKSIVN